MHEFRRELCQNFGLTALLAENRGILQAIQRLHLRRDKLDEECVRWQKRHCGSQNLEGGWTYTTRRVSVWSVLMQSGV